MEMGSSTASMPMKCMDQMPTPSAKAAWVTRAFRPAPDKNRKFDVSRKAAKDAIIAAASEQVTRSGE